MHVPVKINSLNLTPLESKIFIRKIMSPLRRVLEGREKEQMLTLFRLVDPIHVSNNQRSFTEEYEHAGKKYDIHYFDDEIIIEEIINNEES